MIKSKYVLSLSPFVNSVLAIRCLDLFEKVTRILWVVHLYGDNLRVVESELSAVCACVCVLVCVFVTKWRFYVYTVALTMFLSSAICLNF